MASTGAPIVPLTLGRMQNPNDGPFRVEFFDDNGEVRLRTAGRFDWKEPVCPVCHEPIAWCLDLFSFSTGNNHVLTHARCAWQPDVFDTEKAAAIKDRERIERFWRERSAAGG